MKQQKLVLKDALDARKFNPRDTIYINTANKFFANKPLDIQTKVGAGKEGVTIYVSTGYAAPTKVDLNDITGSYVVTKIIPAMDYVIECGNRLWGCRYGQNNNGEFVNEIYASALGDFKTWYKFETNKEILLKILVTLVKKVAVLITKLVLF